MFILLAVYAPGLLVLIIIGILWLDHKSAKRMSANPNDPHDPMSGPQ
jgi:hypothetical protein